MVFFSYPFMASVAHTLIAIDEHIFLKKLYLIMKEILFFNIPHQMWISCIRSHLFSDEVIRKRLLIEGDGGNDDRRITSLLKNYIKFCSSTKPDEDK